MPPSIHRGLLYGHEFVVVSGPSVTFSPHAQGVSRSLVENSRTLRLPTHLHERLGLIRNAKMRLEENGITPSVNVSSVKFFMSRKRSILRYYMVFFLLACVPIDHQNIAARLNMSQKKVRNATEVTKSFVAYTCPTRFFRKCFLNIPFYRQAAGCIHLTEKHFPL